MKVLFLCYYFPPIGMGGTQRAAKFVKYLPQFGWKPVVITVKEVHYYAHDSSLLDEIKDIPVYRTESLDPLRLLARFKKLSKKSTANKSKSILHLLNDFIGAWLFIPDSKIFWIPFAIVRAFRLIQQNKIKIIFTTSPPHSVHLAGLILRWITPIKWIADFRDDWTGGESQPCPTPIHHRINRFLEKVVLKKADHVIGMCDHLTNVLRKKSRSLTQKFTTIMNGYDRQDFKHVLDIPLNKKFTITHCGSISNVSNPESFLAAVRSLFDQCKEYEKDICIQFIGTDIFGYLQHLFQKYSLGEIIQPVKYLPHHEALKTIMSSHLLLITIVKKTNEEIISGKIFEYLGSGKPILLISSNGYVADLIQTLHRGIVVDDKDINGIKSAIYHYFSLYQDGKLCFNEPLSVHQFDREKLTGTLANLFRELTKI